MITKRLFLISVIPGLIVLLILALANLVYKVPMYFMVQDITANAKIHPLAGILSVLGSFLWCATSVICLFSSKFMADFQQKEDFEFTFFSGILSGYLLLDDTFQIHESISRMSSAKTEMVEKVFFFILFLMFLIYLVKFRKYILNTKYVILLISVSLMGISIFLDAFYNPTGYILTKTFRYNLTSWDYFFEDGFKWMGIIFWFSYFSDTCYKLVRKL